MARLVTWLRAATFAPKRTATSHAAPAAPSAPTPQEKTPLRDVTESTDAAALTVLGRYEVDLSKSIGAGTYTRCYKGVCSEDDGVVAVKVYKMVPGQQTSIGIKFQKQITSLQALQTPFDAQFTCVGQPLCKASPEQLFVQLLHFSQRLDGRPGPDRSGRLYVVTELADGTLKDLLQRTRDAAGHLERSEIQCLSSDIVRAAAALHAKGLVHLDLKSENLLVFGGRLKLNDVDGVKVIGTKVAVHDESVSFTPIYCAPEWARFVVEGRGKIFGASKFEVRPELDAWSVGLTLCELLTLDALLQDKWEEFGRRQSPFLRWLAALSCAPLPQALAEPLRDVVSQLTGGSSERSTALDCLRHSFFSPSVGDAEKAEVAGGVSGFADLTLESMSPMTEVNPFD